MKEQQVGRKAFEGDDVSQAWRSNVKRGAEWHSGLREGMLRAGM